MDKESLANHEWYDLFWFRPSTLESFVYEEPWILYLALLPLLVLPIRVLLNLGKKGGFTVATFTGQIKGDFWSLTRFINPIFAIATVGLLAIALARPQKTSERTEKYTKGIDIMLTLDISRSMELNDLKPNRLEATKQVARQFVKGRQGDRIGLTVFAGASYSLCPLTNDYALLMNYIDELNFDMIKEQGTAIGSAMGVSVNRLRETSSPSRVAILLSDGENNAGNLDPRSVSDMAKAYDITFYTIGVGREGEIPFGKDPFGRQQYVKSAIDIKLLKEVAANTGGKFFRATDNKALSNIFKEIDTLEKTETVENRYQNTTDYYHIYLYWAMLAMFAWLFFKLPIFTNVFTD